MHPTLALICTAVMLYFSNFVRTGNPNESPEPEHGGRQEKSRLKNIEWTPYETVHKKYLNLGECLLMILCAIQR